VERHHDEVAGHERDQTAHRREVLDPRGAKTAKAGDQPPQLHWLVEREAGHHQHQAEAENRRVRQLLQRIVGFALRRLRAEQKVVLNPIRQGRRSSGQSRAMKHRRFHKGF
jgi:hypothetical protein